MKTSLNNTLALLFASAAPAMAALNPEAEAFGLVARLFITFLALVLVTQLLPGLMLLISMIGGLFGKEPKPQRNS
ncbi:hypothetical protein DESUT3_18540 [Desulfuromonas versatilis]|uniref:Flagellar biosynthetic protein FliP n=1 Tax=Desulfuromonas versatilis TaxID=2802975 RepID=A0ABN6DXL9_9BACT|nr:hypothetical protein [Desulfuromonas versatilis]BCR04785.1 hypothetical protein DESUT3_18540 [Desulfuromonas versatilis]